MCTYVLICINLANLSPPQRYTRGHILYLDFGRFARTTSEMHNIICQIRKMCHCAIQTPLEEIFQNACRVRLNIYYYNIGTNN